MEVSPYISIADCELCQHIPQKIAKSESHQSEIPAEVSQLETVVEFDEDTDLAYCTSLTRLLKCSKCGTYYYWNHYIDEGQHFMDPTCNNITVRRYHPLAAIRFLEGIAHPATSVLPPTMGRLVKAFSEGTSAPSGEIANKGIEAKIQTANQELKEVKNRYQTLMREFIDIIQKRPLEWQIKAYISDALCAHFLVKGDWDSLGAVLLKHKDVVIGVEIAKFIIGIATKDAPIIDIVYLDQDMRTTFSQILSDKNKLRELVQVLYEGVFTDAISFEYDHGFGSSKYYEAKVRFIALYGLVVAANWTDITFAVRGLMGLLSTDKTLNHHVCWVLHSFAQKLPKRAQVVLDEFGKIDSVTQQKLVKDPEVVKLLAECGKKDIKLPPKPVRSKSTKKPKRK